RRLFQVFKRDNERNPSSEEIKELTPQGEKTAEYVYYQYALKGRSPTQDEMKLISGRAWYEIERLPEIRSEIIEEWKDEGEFKKGDGIRAHMVAERLASVEGRLYFEAKQGGLAKPSNLSELARDEVNRHIDQTRSFSQGLASKHNLS